MKVKIFHSSNAVNDLEKEVNNFLSNSNIRIINQICSQSEDVKFRNKTLYLFYEEINKPSTTTNEQPTYCKAKSEYNNPGYPECNCHNFCKYDNIQFDTDLG